MALNTKIDLKNNVEVGIPNIGNLTHEDSYREELYRSLTRTTTGVSIFESNSSGQTYSTDDYPSDSDVYNKGEQGIMVLLGKYIIKTSLVKAEDWNGVVNSIGDMDDLTESDLVTGIEACLTDIENCETEIGTKATVSNYTGTLDKDDWSGTSAPYSQAITVTGILSTDTPIIDVTMSGTYSTDETRIDEWSYIYRAVTSSNTITFYATNEPTVDLPFSAKAVR